MTVRLAILTDLHHGRDTGKVRGPEALGLLAEIVGQIHLLEPDAVIELGDRLTDENPELDRHRLLELAHEFKRLPYPRHHLVGNHDMLPKTDQEAILSANLGNHVAQFANLTLIFLDTYNGTTGGAFSMQTLTWLEETLRNCKTSVVVFSHQPLHGQWLEGNPYFESDYRDHSSPEGSDLARQILENNGNVKLCVSGHAHWFDHRFVNGIPYITLLGPTESHWSNGLACGAWTLLELGEQICLEQFGSAPQKIVL
jgi:3',5'-cyclic-AMP phosphodiesterase